MSDSNDIDYDEIILMLMSNENLKEFRDRQKVRMAYLTAYCIILIFGVILNITVILIGWWKYEQLQKVVIWILALAVTHLVSCVSVVLQLLYVHNDFKWNYGNAVCKLSSFITYGSMFSTAAMLSFWSIRSSRPNSSCFKIKNCNIILISLSWTIAAVLACPSLFSREVREQQCIDDYDFYKKATTEDGLARQKTVVVMRFLIGLLLPALIMFISSCVPTKQKLCKTQAEICAIKIVYFVCWGPQIFLSMLQTSVSLGPEMTTYVLPGVTILGMSHCFISPLLYLLLGCKKIKLMTDDPNHDHNNEMRESLALRSQT